MPARGPEGEALAERFLRAQRYKFVARNYAAAGGELDLVFRDRETIVFVEVKTQRDARLADPEWRVSTSKRRKLIAAARQFIAHKKLHDAPLRFDIVAVLLPDEGGTPTIRHLPDAFVPEKW